jgi:ADP-heptose:LPS heptosyltransferase
MRDPRTGGLRIDGVVVALVPSIRPADVDTIVVLRALGLGDLLTGVPALRGVRRAYPEARILLAAPAQYRELALLSGAVDDVLPTEGLGDVRELSPPPALAVNMHGRGPQSIEHLLTWQPEKVITHRHHEHPGLSGPPWCDQIHEVDRWCRLMKWAGIDCDPADVAIRRPDVDCPTAGAVVIHPGASAPARRWPVDRFATVAAALRDRGHRVVLTGSSAESDLAHSVARVAGLPADAVMAGRLSLPALVALLYDSRLVICGDTGVAHLAAATGTASVVLFGPVPPERWGPRNKARHAHLWLGDLGDPHADRPDPGLMEITVAQVLSAADWVLAEAS